MSTAAQEKWNISKHPDDILQELHKFTVGAAQESKVGSDSVARSALYLLHTLPAARQAVLQHLSNMFIDAVNHHILMLELDRDMAGNLTVTNKRLRKSDDAEDPTLNDVHDVLMDFVKSRPDAWAPIISEWCIELLGRISSKYSDQQGVPHSSNLNELLQLWMTCQPTKILIEIVSQCFAAMVDNTPDICVDALLEASVKHSPHFDWVVAHIGSCFPTTIITRVLMCGLKDFVHHGGSESGPTNPAHKMPKMASVVGILGHLAARHGNDIRKALLVLFKDSLNGGERDVNVVAFLLHLASLSPMLLQVIATDFITTVTPHTLNQLAKQMAKKQTVKNQDPDSLINLTVHLITKCQTGAHRVLNFILDVAQPKPKAEDSMDTDEMLAPVVQQTATVILDRLAEELEKLSHGWLGSASAPQSQIPVLTALKAEARLLSQDLVIAHGKRQFWLGSILQSVACQCGVICASDILSFLLQAEPTSHNLGTFLHICEAVESKHADVLFSCVDQSAQALTTAAPKQRLNIVCNLKHLLLWQAHNAPNQATVCRLTSCIMPHLQLLSEWLTADNALATAVMQLLVTLGPASHQQLLILPNAAAAVVSLFFRSLHLKDSSIKVQICSLCRQYLQILLACETLRRSVLRSILEGILSKEHAVAFGCRAHPKSSKEPKAVEKLALLESNQKAASSVVVPRMHSTVFHAGVIGQGVKPPLQPSPFSKDEQMQNQLLVLELLQACSSSSQSDLSQSEEAGSEAQSGQSETVRVIPEPIGRHLALLLIELAAPDVMYNGLPWPEEDFMKITVERDLLIRNVFDDNPILWDLLELVATSPGCLCYCSSLLRGVCATLISFWESCREKKACNIPKTLNMSCKLIRCMRQGQFLPAPLGNIDELLQYLTPYEVYLLLSSVWKFMKEKPPTPDPRENSLRTCESRHMKVVRNILHSNISTLGHVYTRFFPPK